MDEEARYQIHLRNQMEKMYKTLVEAPKSEHYYLWIDKGIASAIDEEFWNLLDDFEEE